MTRTIAAASIVLGACGGHVTEKLVYDGHVLEPKKIVFAYVKTDQLDTTLAVISDRDDYCMQFDGLGCKLQPHIGTTLRFQVRGFATGDHVVGDSLSAGWLDFQGVRALEGDATSGVLKVDEAEADKRFGGTFDLELPKGNLKGAFTAEYCKPLYMWLLGCGT